MGGLIELLAVLVAIYIFVKFCGFSQRFVLGAGAKKAIYIITAVALVIANYLYASESELPAIIVGFTVLILFTIALMSETRTNE